jgi:hypothetical protein
LLSAILFQIYGDSDYLEQAKAAVEFHLRTSPTEYRPMSEWMYHWDFQNYALALTFRILRDHLPPDALIRWKKGLAGWRTNHRNKLTNWAGMRAWAHAERYDLLGGFMDKLRRARNLKDVKKARNADGCFDDNPGLSRPIQYHIFTVAIVHRIYLLTRDPELKRWFDEGVSYFLPFIDPDGSFNYVGRGHEQIFGYGSAIYALEAACHENGDETALAGAQEMMDYLLQFKKDRHFPLVLNDCPDEKRPGWYDYHHLTVYNAFLGVWLALAHLISTGRVSARSVHREYKWFSKPTNTLVYSGRNYFAAFYGGLSEYLSEPGVTPQHLWWKDLGVVFSCPGGPTPDRFGERCPDRSETNMMAPIAKNATRWYVPAFKQAAHFDCQDNQLLISFDYGPFSVDRQVRFKNDSIDFEDAIRFKQDKAYEDFRFFNMPVLLSRFEILAECRQKAVLQTRDGGLTITFDDNTIPFELGETICSAKGNVRSLMKRRVNYNARSGNEFIVKFSLTAN